MTRTSFEASLSCLSYNSTRFILFKAMVPMCLNDATILVFACITELSACTFPHDNKFYFSAPERETDSDDDLPKRDCAGDASSGKKDDAMDIDLVQEVDTDDDDYDCSSRGDVDDSDFSDSGKPELDVKNKNAGCDASKHFGSRWSLRLAGFTNESFVENRYLGTKNRSRQRPVHNSALDAVVIRDSEDDS